MQKLRLEHRRTEQYRELKLVNVISVNKELAIPIKFVLDFQKVCIERGINLSSIHCHVPDTQSHNYCYRWNKAIETFLKFSGDAILAVG